MTVRNFDEWRLTICQNVTIRHTKQNSEDIRIALSLDTRRDAADYMKEIARIYPDNFEYGVIRQRAILKHTGGTP